MKKLLLHLGIVSVAAACGMQLMAKPAKPGLLSVPTADGSDITVRLTGDEFYHQYFTEDGYPLLEKNGLFYYCDFDAQGNVIDSGIKAGEMNARSADARNFLAKVDKSALENRIALRAQASPRRANLFAPQVQNGPARAGQQDDNQGPPFDRGYGLFPDQRFPAYGDQKAIVILVEYTDVKFHTDYNGGVTAIDYFTRMLNEDDFNDYGGTGSAGQFFRQNSGNHFRPEFDVYGPITLAHNMAYYGGNGWGGDDQNPGAMVAEAVEALDDEVDFSEYDRNGDGIVDNIFVFYAGRGEASGGGADTVWPHSWNMASAGYPNLYVDGVRVYTYGCSNEWESGRPDGVGTFVHEFSHVMGIPDLYATRYTSSFTPGSWSAMDYGPYNNDGMTPPNYGAFERYALGWLKPREIDRALFATLQPVSENVCGIIRTSKDTEFFLVENRQKEGWDAYIPGHGMLVWHVDYNESVWSRNEVNNTPSHQYCDIEEADGTQNEYSRSGDSFPGAAGVTEFTSSTNPAMKTWSNTPINFPITNITETNGLITFDVLGGAEPEDVPELEISDPSDITPDSFTLNWSAPEENNDVILSLWYLKSENPGIEDRENVRAAEDDDVVFITGYRNRNMGSETSVTVQNLPDNALFHYSVQHSSGWYVSEPVEGIAFTGKRTIDYYSVIASDATDITPESFVANWEPLEDATSYEVSLFSLEPGDPFFETNGFDNGQTMLKGWTTTAGNTYAIPSYCGEAAPSLRLSNNQEVVTPEYNDFIKSVKFWSRGNNTTTGDMIRVEAYGLYDSVWTEYVEVSKAIGGKVTEITNLPECTTQIRFVFERKGTTGALAFDDVTIGYGQDFDVIPVDDVQNVNVGDKTDYKFTGLDYASYYAFTVRATDGELFSRPSQMIRVKTTSPVGVENISSGAFALSVDGLQISANTSDEIVVADFTGTVIARGSYKVTLPRAGLYIVSVPAQKIARKILVK